MHYCFFDIDGTLLNSGGAGQAAMEAALVEVLGIDRRIEGIGFAGRTDRAIVADMFAFLGRELDEETRIAFLDVYLRHLPGQLSARDGVVLPGIPELLTSLGQREDVVLGLLTGNFRRGAWTKLGHYALHTHFEVHDVGGFGDDHVHRDDVARQAHARAREHFGNDPEPGRVWVIGDTPADVQCGRAIGANVIAVATGHYARADLEATSPHHLFDDFSAHDDIVALIR